MTLPHSSPLHPTGIPIHIFRSYADDIQLYINYTYQQSYDPIPYLCASLTFLTCSRTYPYPSRSNL